METEVRHQFYRAFEAKALKSRSFLTRIADRLTAIFGSTGFLILNAIFFAVWIPINLNLTPIGPFDPYPFGLLTMIVSLEAIFLSIFVLVSQNRSSYVDNLREELHLQVNLIAEEEITKILKVLAEVREKVGIKEEDPELDKMIKRINTNYIEQSIVEQLAKADKPIYKDILSALSKEFPDIIHPTTPIKDMVSAFQKGENMIQEKITKPANGTSENKTNTSK